MLMNALPILKEILAALEELYKEGKEHTIFINKLPITDEDRELLLDVLGRGQVSITYRSKTQPAEWWETSLYGVWVGVIKDRDGKVILETIEVTYFPKLAAAQPEDVKESVERLRARLEEVERKFNKM
ncbi:MAG: hydrogenase expression/formation protein [Aquificae bacterium]|nr:hydrogenase expression/formation protein [Aquificota bacterium]